MLFEELFQGCYLEDETTEFKGILAKGDDGRGGSLEMGWLKTIVAFANGSGGKLFVGIEDKSHTIVALDKKTADKQVQLIYQEMKNRLETVLDIKVVPHIVPSGGEHCIVLEVVVPKANFLPVMIKDRGASFTFVRRFGRTSIATSSEMLSLLLQNDNVSFDARFTDRKYDPKDFESLLALYEKNVGEKLEEKTLVLKGFISAEGYLSEGAFLFMDSTTSDLTTAVIAKYAGFDRGTDEIPFVKKMKGPIHSQILELVELVGVISQNGLRKTPEGEERLVSYPKRSVLEAIANAFSHRNYWMDGTQIQVDVFIDRLEVVSPGALATIGEVHRNKELLSIRPFHRNKVISSMLELLGLAQGLGTGFNRIVDDYAGTDENHRPFIDSSGTSFCITLPDTTYWKGVLPRESLMPMVYTNLRVLTEKEHLLLGYCYYTSKGVKDIAAQLNMSVSSYLNNLLAKLEKEGLLVLVGDNPRRYITNHAHVKVIG